MTKDWFIRLLDRPQDLPAVEQLQRLVWPGSETDIIPTHLLLAIIHSGGLLVGAYAGQAQPFSPLNENEAPLLVGVCFSCPGFYLTPDGPRLKQASHLLAVHPEFRNRGLGFDLKRAQWQLARRQGLDRITWTFDPLLSPNAFLNITRLGAVCNTYWPNFYGDMRDGINAGLPSDRFEVDWWVNSRRVYRRLSKRARGELLLEQVLGAGGQVINPALLQDDLLFPARQIDWPDATAQPLLLVQIPPNFQSMRAAQPDLALTWRMHGRVIFPRLFELGYLITDFIHRPAPSEYSYYVLSHGESTL